MPRPVFDVLIHEPTRLRLCALLIPVERRDFAGLCEELAVSPSALSKHVRALREKGYVDTERVTGNRQVRVWLTAAGRAAFCGHVAEIQRLATVVRRSEAERGD